jgi:acyl-CoA reductase-like NAD-dependent aldehyde dehydrogenase
MSASTALMTVTSRWAAGSEEYLDIDNPADGRVFARVAVSSPTQVDAAVRAAARAQRSWSRRTARERGRYLSAIAAVIREHADEIAALETREMGKPMSQARDLDLEVSISVFEFFGSADEAMPNYVRDQGFVLDVTVLEPYGVIGAIIPFNWPPIHVAGKVAPALAAGNAVVIKPPEQAPLTILRLVELIADVLPDDLVHVVPGGPEVGARLAAHPGVGKVSFTGSPNAGRAVIRTAAENLTPTLMELGGKNGLIIFDTADLDLAVAGAVEGGYFNQGEACSAASRILVQRGRYDEVVERLARATERLVVGDGADPGTHVGPLVSRAQRDKVLGYIDIGVAEGARLVSQAALPTDPGLAGGYYVPPTLFADVTAGMRIATEEIFGPVVTVIPFDDEEQAIDIANGTEFGLMAAVYSQDAGQTLRVSRLVRAGIVFVNNYNRMITGLPFGGVGHSGYGREHALQTLAEYGYSKSIRMPSGLGAVPTWAAVDEVIGGRVSPGDARS